MTYSALLYRTITHDGSVLYLLAAPDNQFTRPVNWDNQVTELFDLISPQEIITPFSLQNCYNQYDGQATAASGFNAYDLSSSSTASIILRHAINRTNYDNPQEIRPYRFTGLMTRASYYTFSFLRPFRLAAVFALDPVFLLSRFYDAIGYRNPGISLVLRFIYHPIVSLIGYLRAFNRIVVGPNCIFDVPGWIELYQQQNVWRYPALSSLATIGCIFALDRLLCLGLATFAASSFPWLMVVILGCQIIAHQNIPTLFNIFRRASDLAGSITALFSHAVNGFDLMPAQNFSFYCSQAYDRCASLIPAESLLGRDYIVHFLKQPIHTRNLVTEPFWTQAALNNQTLQSFINTVLQFFGYRCTFNRQPHQPQIEAMPHDDEIRPKLAIIPASLLLGQNGLAQSLLARPCLLFQPNLERPEKEIRDFADKNALNEFVMQIQ